ncbi:MAG TPA: FAD:protein FMN transferase [Lamprocystis sp. (in: g-proteobacteria)]|nr:FAD:protein FMN transferase [Lamprocystis sp. (in: g-proteobacteria)]
MTLPHFRTALKRQGLGLLALAWCALLFGCGRPADPQLEITGPTMGTYYAVKVARPPAGLDAATLNAGITKVLAAVIGEISTYDPDSELSRLNRNPSTDWVPVSSNLYQVLAAGQRISDLSGGAFDITVGPLVNLWGFGPQGQTDRAPAPELIKAALERVGHGKLELRADPPAVRKQRGDIYIDLSALGEGVGADRMATYLDDLGATDYMAAVAGTMRVRGKNARGQPWGIAIEQPNPAEQVVQRILPVTDSAVSTSGDYRNFFEAGGKRYSHHIDPKTGTPVMQRLASTSVVVPVGTGTASGAGPHSAMTADGLATALLVMGETRGPALAESQALAAYFIIREDSGFRELSSPAFQRLY